VTGRRDREVVVAGGGPAGAAAALALARAGRHVLLVGGSSGGGVRTGEALPPASRPLLRDLGVLDRLLADGHLPSHGNVSAWGSHEVHATDFVFDVHGHGWHLDRARFDALLRNAARSAGAEVAPAGRVLGLDRDGGGLRVRVTGPQGAGEVRCRWLVDATGRAAAVARGQRAERVHEDRLIAFVARFRSAPAADRDSRTLIEARPDGWWYTVRVPSGERVVGFLTDGDLVDRATLLSPRGFAARLAGTERVSALLAAGRCVLVGRPRGADAGSARLGPFAGPGWVAAGDAAISFDPLSSQGIFNGLYTGLRAGQAVAAALGGDDTAVGGYVDRLAEIHRAYRANLARFYAGEARWPDHPFWRRRRSGPPAEPAAVSSRPAPGGRG
jgi:flavin-dependent dehydrogenase